MARIRIRPFIALGAWLLGMLLLPMASLATLPPPPGTVSSEFQSPPGKPEGLHVELSVSPARIRQGERIVAAVTLENRGSERLVLDRRMWDISAAPMSEERLFILDETRNGYYHAGVTGYYTVFGDVPIGDTANLPSEFRIEIEPGDGVTLEAVLSDKLSPSSLLRTGRRLAVPGDFKIFYVPSHHREEARPLAGQAMVLTSPYVATLQVDEAEALPLEQARAAGGNAWYIALIAAAEKDPQALVVLLDEPLEFGEFQDIVNVLSLVNDENKPIALNAMSRLLDENRNDRELGVILTSVRQIRTERAIEVLEKIMRSSHPDADPQRMAVIRAGAANAISSIDRARGRAAAESAREAINASVDPGDDSEAVREAQRALDFLLQHPTDPSVRRIEMRRPGQEP